MLLDTFERALAATMQPNYWPSMGGGGLEQVGATHAVNELLLQARPALLGSWDAFQGPSQTRMRYAAC